MTTKLYYKNTYIKEFNANIIHIVEKDDKFHVELNQTAFFPEGGGQPSDTGYIDDIKVTYVYEEKDKIYHVIDKLPSKLDNIKCTINWEKRFDNMQQHLGQHILSAAFEKLYDANTIGFHLSSTSLTIDIDRLLTSEDIKKVEYFANQIVFNDLSVKTLYPTEKELNSIPLRKPPTVKDNIRIVEIDDFDYSPCCGTHTNRTGEVGLIKIRKFEKYKSGLRIDFLCGNRSLEDYFEKNNIINSITSNLSVRSDEILNNLERIKEDIKSYKKENKYLKEKIINYETTDFLNNAEVIKNIKIIRNIFEDRDFNELKQLSSTLVNTENVVCIFGANIDNQAKLLFSRSKNLDKINMKNILNDCITLIDGKGGGSPFTAQGGGKNISNLEKAVNFAYKKTKDYLY